MFFIIFRWSEPFKPLQQPITAEKETKITYRLHEPSNFRTRKTFPLPKISESGGSWRNRVEFGINECTSDNVVPESAGEIETRHGRIKKRRGKYENTNSSQKFLGKRTGFGYFKEKSYDGRRWGLSKEFSYFREIIFERKLISL